MTRGLSQFSRRENGTVPLPNPYPYEKERPFFWRTGAAFADFDGDGKPDVLACVEWSVYPFYRHAAIEMPRRPEYVLSLPERH